MKKLPYQEMRDRRQQVADFSTRQDLIEHERAAGATHVHVVGSGATLYYPTRGGQYAENRAWKQHGYWHGHAPNDRFFVDQLPSGAEPIESFLSRSGGRRAAETPRQVRDYVAVDNRGKRVAGPSKSFDDMKREADRAGGYVQFAMGGVSEAGRARGTRSTRRTHQQSPGAKYAADQVQSDHFRNWMWDQMIEADQMRRRDPSSVMPLESEADYAKLARSMLQQLKWDIGHNISPRELEDLIGSSKPNSTEVKQFFDDLHEKLRDKSMVDWVADEAASIREQIQKKPPRRASESSGRRTQWPDWMILDSIDKAHALTPEAYDRAQELVRLGFVDTKGTWRLTLNGQRAVKQKLVSVSESTRPTARPRRRR